MNMKIHLDPSTPMNLDETLCCGQVFRWEKREDWWYGVARKRAIRIRQIGRVLEFENANKDFVESYFGLNDDLRQIYTSMHKDPHIEEAIARFRGLRILRQDPWECLVSFMCATYKNIAAIKTMISELSHRYGDHIVFEKENVHAFPTAEALAKSSITDLKKCGLGFRAKRVKLTAKVISDDATRLERLRRTSYAEAKRELLQLPGVGSKVADCILLFSLNKFEAFPVDVWMKRVILRYYQAHFEKEFVERISEQKPLSTSQYERLSRFGREHFGNYAGYAQEYLYHYERMKTRLPILRA
jgi:N-glycosylase/DNA lyase